MKITQDRVGAGCLFPALYALGGSVISVISTMAKCWGWELEHCTVEIGKGRIGSLRHQEDEGGRFKQSSYMISLWNIFGLFWLILSWEALTKKIRETGLVIQILARRDRFFFVFLKCSVETLGWHDRTGWLPQWMWRYRVAATVPDSEFYLD